MKPYNVEIFNRNLNFKYSALLDADDFSASEDAMDPVKNTVNLPKDFVPLQLDPTDPRAPRGWYVRILGEEMEVQGIVTAFESDEEKGRLTFSQMITRLDLNMLVGVGDISASSSIESYIKQLITAEFINSADAKQVIPGLTTVTTTTSTTGTFAYTDTDDETAIIDFLDDIVYPAFELYSIVTNVRFDPQTKTINITIGRKDMETVTIEADLPNIASSSFVIQKYSKEVNKIDCYDIAQSPPSRTSYYLHTGGSWDSDPSDNRLLPVINEVVQLDGYAVAKAIIDGQLNELMLGFIGVNELNRTLTTSEYATLTAFTNKVLSAYVAAHQISKPSISGSDDVSIGSTRYDTSRQNYEEYHASLYWEDDVITESTRLRAEYKNVNVHTMLSAIVQAKRTYGGQQWTRSESLQVPFMNSNASTAISDYKKTSAYEAEIQAIYSQAVATAMHQRAKALFAKNKYSNLITLSVLSNDTLVNPLTIPIGATAQIIHKGTVFNSILSGRQTGNGLTTLTFGTVRLELTSYLKGRY